MIASFGDLQLTRAAVNPSLVACAHKGFIGALAVAFSHARVERAVGRLLHPEVNNGEGQHHKDGPNGWHRSAHRGLGKDLL